CLQFPDLADDYMANLLHASDIWTENPGSRKEYRRRFPETKYGYWKSFVSKRLGFPLYCSTSAWVAPATIEIDAALTSYGFLQPRPPIRLDPAQLFRIEGHPALLVTEQQAVSVPDAPLKHASHFTAELQPFGN